MTYDRLEAMRILWGVYPNRPERPFILSDEDYFLQKFSAAKFQLMSLSRMVVR